MNKSIFKFLVVLAIILIIIFLLTIWFNIPFSPLKNEFDNDLKITIENNSNYKNNEKYTKDDFSHLPYAIQKYVEYCGFLGKDKMSYVQVEYKNVSFKQGKEKPSLIMDYVHYNFINPPVRLAFIDSSIFCIPFEGYDYFNNGKGGMRGVIAKSITIFNETGSELDEGSLATLLAESFLIPSMFLQDYIHFQQINEYEVRATITYDNMKVSGSFCFNEKYEMIKFKTESRALVDSEGNVQYIPWSGICTDYKLNKYGIKSPARLQAVWHYNDGDFIYFDGAINDIVYK